MEAIYGYARVSAEDQNLDTQLDELPKAGCTRIFKEKISGATHNRPALDQLLEEVRPGDTIVVTRFVRLGRSAIHIIGLLAQLEKRGVFFRALDLGIDTRTPAGKMVSGIFAVLGQYELENNREKSLAGIRLAKNQGKHMGRPKGRDAGKMGRVKSALARGMSVNEIAELTGISPASVKRYRRELQQVEVQERSGVIIENVYLNEEQEVDRLSTNPMPLDSLKEKYAHLKPQ